MRYRIGISVFRFRSCSTKIYRIDLSVPPDYRIVNIQQPLERVVGAEQVQWPVPHAPHEELYQDHLSISAGAQRP